MQLTWIIWLMVIFWISNYALAFGSAAIIMYVRRAKFTLVLTGSQTTLLTVVAAVYGAWLVVNMGSAAQTWRSSRSSIAVVFLVQMYTSFTLELLVLSTVFVKRDVWINEAVVHIVKQLVLLYPLSSDAKNLLDGFQETFECCGLTQWHYEFWMDDSGGIQKEVNTTYAWVPQSCCIRTAYYNNCGLARPQVKRLESTDSEDAGDFEIEEIMELRGSFAAAEWYTRLNNEPCPDMFIDYLGEWPTYVLMSLISLSVGKATISTAASMAVFSKKTS